MRGDVIGIFNSSGTKIANYSYDSWSNCAIKTLVSNNFADYNPIRYRGYYYDRETKLYYLNARYYSPEWRRFISPDSTEYLDPDTPNGLNLYIYCNNDPVNYADPSGHKAKWWQWLISGLEVVGGVALCFIPGWQAVGASLIGVGAGAIVNAYITEANGGTFNAGWIGGQAAGLVSLIPGIGCLAPTAGAVIGSVITDWIDVGFDSINWSKALWSGVLAAGISCFPTLIGQIAEKYKIIDPAVYLINAYNGFVAGIANSIVNVFWREKQWQSRKL